MEGVLNEGFHAIIEFQNSYYSSTHVPPAVIEKVKKLLDEDGLPSSIWMRGYVGNGVSHLNGLMPFDASHGSEVVQLVRNRFN